METTDRRLTYNNSVLYWRQYQNYIPEEIRLDEKNLPLEEWWKWNSFHIHVDRMQAIHSKIKVILIHGAGGNGRLLAPYAMMLQQHGYEVVSPDLPPYGLSYSESAKFTDYSLWIQILSDFIQYEIQRDGKPIVLLGTSIGGMLAYHTAVKSKQIKGLIATTFIDTRSQKVRDQLAPNTFTSRFGKILMDLLSFGLDPLRIPITAVSRMHLITNNSDLTKLIMNDPHAAGIKIPLRLLRTFLNFKPEVEPEHFNICPVLLIHPEIDPMTPFSISEPFFNRLACEKKCVILEGAGHFPIEQPGMNQMKKYVIKFLERLE
ncbi:alpha/beta hydrolase [Ectobacillus panaciterrae]|uniref:alpha/beta hydrolase n=1 Tax=Ectobacillus panaciterrae TaxID=363872 RepID=UPI0004212958|nr:alpha/beta hydrolase [Ectobacillus panaciterrae]